MSGIHAALQIGSRWFNTNAFVFRIELFMAGGVHAASQQDQGGLLLMPKSLG